MSLAASGIEGAPRGDASAVPPVLGEFDGDGREEEDAFDEPLPAAATSRRPGLLLRTSERSTRCKEAAGGPDAAWRRDASDDAGRDGVERIHEAAIKSSVYRRAVGR
ncbi:hypothetical protein WME79_29925 [Sorangium sp. So ce726]|uniref:hypothetical protein n=1 Tax=Sorangium sp. So ce726 TaxID=3133319 RepID=UPI003F5FEAAF